MRWFLLFPFCSCVHAPVLDARAVRDRTQAVFRAYDNDDASAFSQLVAPAFVRFDHLRELPAEVIATELRARHTAGDLPRERTCQPDTIALAESFAVFNAICTERFPPTAEDPAIERRGWNTVVWVRERSGWRVAHWNWKPLVDEREMWNNVFETGAHFKRTPNAFLIEVIRGRTPGAALDLMTGQGRNALHLAALGWQVTGVDISDVGLRFAREAARRDGVSVDFVQADVERYDLGVGRWDLVTMIYAGTDRSLIARAKRATRAGGVFVVEFFAKEGDPMGFARDELAEQFRDWTIERDEVVEDVADWSKQRTWLIRFAARKP